MQYHLFSEPGAGQETTYIENGEYLLIERLFSQEASDDYFQLLKAHIDWQQDEVMMYGKKVKFPRLSAWYGDAGKQYSFSGNTFAPKPWNETLLSIKQQVEAAADTAFNSVLLNLYRWGQDSMSWHSDDEPELGLNPVIASVSFGEARPFQLRHKQSRQRIDIPLTHGSLLVMKGEMQHYWQHQIPKTKKNIGARVNLTFRWIL